MNQVTLGQTGLRTDKNGFGALPIQRVSLEEAAKILRKAYESGITYFDTARAYSDSEAKMGYALADVRDKIIIASKTMATTVEGFWSDLETSLKELQTDYIDVYQFHTPPFCPKPGDGTGLYEAMLEAKEQGKIRHIAITNHRLPVAEEAVRSGLYELLQFPFSYLSSGKDFDLVDLCKAHNVAFVAMKALSGGLITNSAAAYAWLDQYDQVLPIWGIQKEAELDEFISYISNPPKLTAELEEAIRKDREELAGNFCRGCGYCMAECPAGIRISLCARMAQLIRRMPSAEWLSEESQAMMRKVEDCIDCGHCKTKCPYELDPPSLIRYHWEDYQDILAGKVTV